MQKIILLFSIALPLEGIAAPQKAYEGYFNPGNLQVTPVWMELEIPDSDGPVTGSYFYKKKGLPLQLAGARHGDQIQMSESEKKGAVTGAFSLKITRDSLAGTWSPPKQNPTNTGSSTMVVFYPASPEDKKFAVFPKPRDLKLLDGKTFAQELQESGDEEGAGKKSLPAIGIAFYRKNIVSLSIGGEFTGGAYPQSWSTHFNFDLDTKKEFQVDDEIDSRKSNAFHKLINAKLQQQMTQERLAVDKEEWESAFERIIQDLQNDSENPLDTCFNIDSHAVCGTGDGPNYYEFTGKDLHWHMDHFFGFPHVIQAMDLYLDVSIPLSELKKYLKQDSRLNHLVQNIP